MRFITHGEDVNFIWWKTRTYADIYNKITSAKNYTLCLEIRATKHVAIII